MVRTERQGDGDVPGRFRFSAVPLLLIFSQNFSSLLTRVGDGWGEGDSRFTYYLKFFNITHIRIYIYII